MPKMYVVHPRRYLFRRLEVGEDDRGCLFRLYGLRVGIRAWFRRMLYGRDDVCEFGVYRDRVEMTDAFQRTVIGPRLELFESGWVRSKFVPSCVASVLFIILLSSLFGDSKAFGIVFVAICGVFVWLVYRRSYRLSLNMKDVAGRKIEFDLKRGDFSGPPLPEQALNEMVECLKGMHNANKS